MIKNMIFPLFALGVGGVTVYFFRDSDFYLILANAGVAIFGFLMFLFRASIYKFLLFSWILLQAAIIELETPILLPLNDLGMQAVELNELNFSQALLLSPEQVQASIGGSLVSFNLLTPIYLIAFFVLLFVKVPDQDVLKRPKTKEYGEKSFDVKLFRFNNVMERFLPQKVQVIKQVDFTNSKNWLLVRLTKPVRFKNGRVIYSALIKAKDDGPLKKDVKGQLAYFRIIGDRRLLKQGQLELEKTKFIDWVFVN